MKMLFFLLFLIIQIPSTTIAHSTIVVSCTDMVLGVEHPKNEKRSKAKRKKKNKQQQDKSKISWTVWLLTFLLLLLIFATIFWFLALGGIVSWGFFQLAFGLMIGLLFMLSLFPKKLVRKAYSSKKDKFWSLFLLTFLLLVALVALVLGIHFFIGSAAFAWAALYPSVYLGDFLGIGFMTLIAIISGILIGFMSRKHKNKKDRKHSLFIEILGYNLHALGLMLLLPICFGFFLFFPVSGLPLLIGIAALLLLFGLLFGLSIWLKIAFKKEPKADKKTSPTQRVGAILLLLSILLFAFAIISAYGLIVSFSWFFIPIILSFFILMNIGLWLINKNV